jgi:ribosomal protein S6--L-glutamate ligase
LARRLKKAAGLDLAAVDILAPEGGQPLLLEVNFYFGRRALGGSEPFLVLLLEAVRAWLSGLGLDPLKVRLSY